MTRLERITHPGVCCADPRLSNLLGPIEYVESRFASSPRDVGIS